MKNTLITALLVCASSAIGWSQQTFSHCSAAFLGNKMIVDQYTTKGKCIVPATATGELTVNTVELSSTKSKAVESIPFMVAIRDKNSQTLTRYSKAEVKRVNIRNVLAKCRKGDHIVLLTVGNQYALPHNEILVR
ncbi:MULTISPECIES: hypothetical protein [unclassified Spirosoma]|uniref:hypothetical protein n=1 Tax=unclassified Spirosoma TaxID=2621999 RepID=UPI000959428B|nr:MULTISPECIES: hypothetical protein [unclassified Spirosoma]MBN8821959.1 hypothetical protein [Spirosoma sp.]OJW80372.1 MAG: hypothetical protein BGO59_33315 [Spirosoma sp. 48-14]